MQGSPFARFVAAVVVSACLAAGLSAQRRASIRVMLLDGQNNHAWATTSPVVKKILDETGLFDVTIVTVSNDDIATFAPDWRDYRAVVMNYNTGINATAPEWRQEVKDAFVRYMRDGGGLVSIHAADNGFPRWKEFNEMIGVGGWGGRDERCGPYVYYKDGKLVADDLTPGRGGSHGARWPFEVTVRDAKHPVTRGLPKTWLHTNDEMYDRLRGPAKNLTILATAFSRTDNQGTGRDEPMLMALDYGKGRVFHTVLGHDVHAMSSLGFVVTLQRGTEWAATGRVTQRVPAAFGADPNVVSTRIDLARMDPNYSPSPTPPPAPAAGRGGGRGAAPGAGPGDGRGGRGGRGQAAPGGTPPAPPPSPCVWNES